MRGQQTQGLLHLQIFRAFLVAVRDDIEGHLVPFAQVVQTSLLYSRDVDEHVFAIATIRMNETVAFVALNHFTVPLAIVLSLGKQRHDSSTTTRLSTGARRPATPVRFKRQFHCAVDRGHSAP
jgi:hypothetical protein